MRELGLDRFRELTPPSSFCSSLRSLGVALSGVLGCSFDVVPCSE